MAAASVSTPAYGAQGPPAWREDLNITLMCSDCKLNPPLLIEENADTICGSCGKVLDERLVSYESEWRTFASEEGKGDDPNRVGEADNDLLYGAQGTTIGGSGPNISKEARKLKKAQALQNEDKNNRVLQSGYSQIESWCDANNLTKQVKDSAKQYYKRAYDANFSKGKNTTGILAGCLFTACRQCKVARSFTDIMNLTKVPKKELGRLFKQLSSFLEKDSDAKMQAIAEGGGIANVKTSGFTSVDSTQAKDLIIRYCGMLGMPFRVEVVATKLAQSALNIKELASRSPLSTAGACIYFAARLYNQALTTPEISSVIGVSDATIKNSYKYLTAEKEKLVDPSWLGPQDKQGQLVGSLDNLPAS